MNSSPINEILKEMTPEMTPQNRYNYKKSIKDPSSQNSKLIYDLLNEVVSLREHIKEQKLTISRQKNTIWHWENDAQAKQPRKT